MTDPSGALICVLAARYAGLLMSDARVRDVLDGRQLEQPCTADECRR